MTRFHPWRPVAAALLLIAALVALRAPGGNAAWQPSTPTTYSCADATPTAGTPAAGMAGMDMGSPVAGMDVEMELDQLYIDMMIPHHASIVALSEAALPRLEDERLQGMARAIIDTQSAEIEELRGYRVELYGSADPMPMDAMHMGAMDEAMPGMGSMEEMAFQMNAEAQVAAFCAAEAPDLAFIDLVIPHHEMAITASETAVDQAVNEEIRAFAERVIEDQRREIDELTAIRAELTGGATPSTTASDGHSAHGAAESVDGSAATGNGNGILALTPEEIGQIERGEGGGLALPAELNGVPGPRHVLDLAVDLGLSPGQVDQVQGIFDAMNAEAVPAGATYLAAQRRLEQDFRDGALTEAALAGRVAEVSRLRGELAAIHLVAHLRTASLLTTDQIASYRQLRGTT